MMVPAEVETIQADARLLCRDHCSHHVEISANRWPDCVRLSDVEPIFTCVYGKRGADVRPNFPKRMETS